MQHQNPVDDRQPVHAAGAGVAGDLALEVPGVWRILLDSMCEGVSIATEDGTIVYTNPAEDDLFGYAPGELAGRHVSVLNAYPPEQNRHIVQAVITELTRSGAWSGDWLNRRKDGSEFVSSSRISRVEIDGRTHWLCVRSDVTEARRSAEALIATKARLELVAEAADLGIWDWDLLTDRLTYSDRSKAICGFPRDHEVTIEDARKIVHPEDLPLTKAQARRALDPAIRERAPYQYRLVRPDGSVRRVLAHGEAVFDELAGVTCAVRYAGTIQDITDRWELEEAERAAARGLQLAVDAGRMAVWEVDLLADRIAHSPSLNRLLGYPEDARPTLQELRDGYFPGELERVQAIGAEALARGDRFMEAEYRYRCPDGSAKWLMLRCEILLGESGAPEKAVGVVADITNRKTTEEALRLSQEKLSLARRAAGIGVWEWEFGTGRVETSPEVLEMLGLDPDTPPNDVAEAWFSLIHPEDRAAVRATEQRVQAEGGPYATEYRITRPNGDLRWLRSRGTSIADADGRPARVTGIVSDVTPDQAERERLRTEARALEGEVALRTRERDRIFELSSDIFAVVGHDGQLRSINPAFARLLGRPAEEILKTPVPDLIHPDDRAAAAEAMAALGRGERITHFEDRLITADGQVCWVSWTAVPEGEVFYAIGRDVTLEREREQQLRQAQKLEAIGQLTGGVAHDFNNLLMVFSAGLEMLERHSDADRRRGVAEGMRQAVTRGTSLTRQLLAFARRQALRPEPVDLSVRLGAMRDLLARTLGSNIELRMDFPHDLWPVFVDPGELELAIVNLCVNSRDAMAEGGAIAIAAANLPGLGEADYVRVTISDTGAGMPPEVLSRVFEPFFTTKEVGKGTGLGLPQVYGFAKQSGGHVDIRSQRGEGTEVALLLPRSAEAPAPVEAPEPGPAARRRGVALLVEDDREVAVLVRDMLVELGYEVVQAAGAEAALGALADRRRVDLLLSDIMMPGPMNGIELAREARCRRPGLRVLLVSGYPGKDAHGPEVTGSLVLPKPFTITQLEAALEAIDPGCRNT